MIKMRVIKIKKFMDPRKVARAVENGLTGEAKIVKTDFDTTTQTWKSRPEFTTQSSPGKRIVSTDNEIYGYVDGGTPAHVITAKGPGPLVFGVPSHAKTTPRVIRSGPGGAGSTIVRARQVDHPGTAPRLFSETIAEKSEDRLANTIQRAIDAEL